MFQGSSVSRVVLSLKTQSLSFKLYLEKVGKFWKGENEWKENLHLLCCYFLSNQTDFLTERWVSGVRAGREVAFFRWCSAGLIVSYLDFFFSPFSGATPRKWCVCSALILLLPLLSARALTLRRQRCSLLSSHCEEINEQRNMHPKFRFLFQEVQTLCDTLLFISTALPYINCWLVVCFQSS